MFYANLLNLKNVTYKTINYSSFLNGVNTIYDASVLPSGYTRLSYNFDYTDGALKDGLGISEPSVRYSSDFPEYKKTLSFPLSYSIRGVWLFGYCNPITLLMEPLLIAYTVDGSFYYNYLQNTSTSWIKIDGLSCDTEPLLTSYNLNGVDHLIVSSKSDGMFVWSPEVGVKKIDNVPNISSMCVHYERLFVTSNENLRRVWFSDDLNPTNFNTSLDEGGFIDLVDDFGRSNKVVSFDGYLYVFRDYNIARITAYAEQENFAVTELYVGSGRIFKNTVTLCGNKIMYLASDGLYSFNGSSSTRISLGINNIFDSNNENAVAGFCNGCFYLACRLKFDDDKDNLQIDDIENNALIKYDISQNRFSILRGCNIRKISVINDYLDTYVFVITKDKSKICRLGMVDNSGAIYGEPTEKVWITPDSDFDYPDRYKLVKEVYLESGSDCIVRVKADKKTKDFVIKGGDKISLIKPRMRGKKISVSFLSKKTDTKISNVQIQVGVL